VTNHYWDYATSTNSVPFSDQPPGSDAPTQSNTANFFKNDNIANNYDDGYAVTGVSFFNSTTDYLTNVGAYPLSTSPYGTFDQSGNVSEWNEALIGSLRGFRGGSWDGMATQGLRADFRGMDPPSFENPDRGFRVAMVPEPGSVCLWVTGAIFLAFKRKRATIVWNSCRLR
jgi:formylglycine-generating enzyme